MVDENKVRAAAKLTHKVTSAEQQAAKTVKSAGDIGKKLKKAWEWGEHIHFGYFLWTTAVAPLPAILLWLLRVGENFFNLLLVTAPLTIAVALIVVCIRDSPFENGYWTYVVFPGVALLGAAYLSGCSGAAPVFDWHKVLPPGEYRFQLVAWMLVPLAALEEYYRVYHAPAFFTSVAVGSVLGLVATRKPAPKK